MVFKCVDWNDESGSKNSKGWDKNDDDYDDGEEEVEAGTWCLYRF